MTSITSWSSITYTTPSSRPDKRDEPEFSTLRQDGSAGLDESELSALLDQGPQSASSRSGMPPVNSPSSTTQDSSSDAEGGWAGLRMDTQSFASMMVQGPPPPPPSSGGPNSDDTGPLTMAFGVSRTDSGDEGDDGGDLGTDEVGQFEEKMRTLFSRVQQMGNAEYQSVAQATTYPTNDANLNLSA